MRIGVGGMEVWTSTDIVHAYEDVLWFFQTIELEMLLCAALKQKQHIWKDT
jgi:hypothetical protein